TRPPPGSTGPTTNASPSKPSCSSNASKHPPGSGRSPGRLPRPAHHGRPTTTPTTGKSPASPPTSTSSTKRSPTKQPPKTGKASPNPSKRNSPNSRTRCSPPPPRKGTYASSQNQNPRRRTRRRRRCRSGRGNRRLRQSVRAQHIQGPGRGAPRRRELRRQPRPGRARNRQPRRPRWLRQRLQRPQLVPARAPGHPCGPPPPSPGRGRATPTERGGPRMSAPDPAANAPPAELEYAADPLSRELVREDLVDQTCQKLVDILDKQIRPNLTQAEYAKVIERAKKELDGEPLGEMAY